MEIQQIILIATAIYVGMGIVLVVFAEPLYEYVTKRSMPDAGKGIFAQAIISYYHLRKYGFSAGPKHWVYCLGFNLGVSVSATLAFAFAAFIIYVIVIVIVAIIFLIMLAAAAGSK